MGAIAQTETWVTQDVPGPSRTHTVALWGWLTHRGIDEMLRRFELALENDGGIEAVVIDALALDGFDPGAPARVIHWIGAHAGRVRAIVVVTHSLVLLSTARAAALMLPTTIVEVASERGDAQQRALEALSAPPSRTPR